MVAVVASSSCANVCTSDARSPLVTPGKMSFCALGIRFCTISQDEVVKRGTSSGIFGYFLKEARSVDWCNTFSATFDPKRKSSPRSVDWCNTFFSNI
eukprot:5244747-Prymnesium_polylepis.1